MSSSIFLTVLIILLVVAGIIISIISHNEYSFQHAKNKIGSSENPVCYGNNHNHIGVALRKYARSLTFKHSIGIHPTGGDKYQVDGGAKPIKPRKHWDQYETWELLQNDAGANSVYMKQRSKVLNNPNLDWGPVLKIMTPKLKDNFEYIGVAGLNPDGKTLRIIKYEASPICVDEIDSETIFAGVPSELVSKYASIPGMFLFHTHPADVRGNPLPSSHDLSTAIYFGATCRFAACAVISRYGVLVHGLDWSAYKAINSSNDWLLSVLNLSHDVVASHEAIRSWSSYTILDYLSFYPRHRLLIFTYPSPEMIGDMRRNTYLWSIESPIDHELISDHIKDIVNHISKIKNRNNNTKIPSAITFDYQYE